MSTRQLLAHREVQQGEVLARVDDPGRFAAVDDAVVIAITEEVVDAGTVEEVGERFEPVPDDEYVGQWRVKRLLGNTHI